MVSSHAGSTLARRPRRGDPEIVASCTDTLTAAEHRVLELLTTHMSDRQIGAQLLITRNTVKSHLRTVYRKLGVASRDEAVAQARELGLLKKP